MVDFADASWRKSSYSGGGSNSDCLELARVGDAIGVRDTKHRQGTTLVMSPAAWSAFVDGAKDGEFRR